MRNAAQKVALVKSLLQSGIDDIVDRYERGERESNHPDKDVRSVENTFFRYYHQLNSTNSN